MCLLGDLVLFDPRVITYTINLLFPCIFQKNSANIFSAILVFMKCPEVLNTRLCFTVTSNNPGHDIKRPAKSLFLTNFISAW